MSLKKPISERTGLPLNIRLKQIYYTFFLNQAKPCESFNKIPRPVLDTGGPSDWDRKSLHFPWVILNGNRWIMWYHGWNGETWYDGWDIGVATSADAEKWTKYCENPVLRRGPTGGWDSQRIWGICVLLDDGLYRMWYCGSNGFTQALGYATSEDGIQWEKYKRNPIFQSETGLIINPSIVKEEGIYKMWFSNNLFSNVCLAMSQDGINWKPFPKNPILKVSHDGTWDSGLLFSTSIVKHKDWYIMGYEASNLSLIPRFCAGLAFSTDGIHWKKYWNNPVLVHGKKHEWDNRDATAPSILIGKAETYLFYEGRASGKLNRRKWKIGLVKGPAINNLLIKP